MNARDIIDSIHRMDTEAREAARKHSKTRTTSETDAKKLYEWLVSSWPEWKDLARGYLKHIGVKLSEADEKYINEL